MIRIVSWNIAKRHQPWRELAAMDAILRWCRRVGNHRMM